MLGATLVTITAVQLTCEFRKLQTETCAESDQNFVSNVPMERYEGVSTLECAQHMYWNQSKDVCVATSSFGHHHATLTQNMTSDQHMLKG